MEPVLDYIMTKTRAGLALDQKIPNSEKCLTLTKAKAGAGRVALEALNELTDLVDVRQELILNPIIRGGEDTTIVIPVTLSNRGIEEGYAVYQIGVYAEDPDLGEILYQVAQSTKEEGEAIPSAASSPGFSIDWDLNVNVANAETVQVVVSEAGRLTIDQADHRYSRKEQQVTTTLTASTWNPETKTYSFEETYPSETYNLNVEPIDCTQEQAEAWGAILPMGSSSSNVLTALGDVPTVDIPVLLTIKRK